MHLVDGLQIDSVRVLQRKEIRRIPGLMSSRMWTFARTRDENRGAPGTERAV